MLPIIEVDLDEESASKLSGFYNEVHARRARALDIILRRTLVHWRVRKYQPMILDQLMNQYKTACMRASHFLARSNS